LRRPRHRAAALRHPSRVFLQCEPLEERSVPSAVHPTPALHHPGGGPPPASAPPDGTGKIRVATYNMEADINGVTTPRPGFYQVLEGIGEEVVQGNVQPVDIVGLQETTSNGTTVAPIRANLNSYYGGAAVYAQSPYQA